MKTREVRVSIQLIRKNFRLAAFAVVAALGVSFMPTQAQAQVRPVVTNCVFQLRAGAHGCGSTVAIQVQRTGVGGAIYWDVRSKLMRPSGALFWSGDVYNMTTGT
jgi:hypothetical protein